MRYWLLKNLVVAPLFRLFFRVEVHGAENIPKTGPGIIAPNHLSVVDSVFVPISIRRHVAFLAKEQFFAGKGFGASVRRGFMKAMKQLEIERGGGAASSRSLTGGAKVLSEGRLLGMYPEGTRSPDGRLHRGRTGIARILLEVPAPVIPVAVHGTAEIMPKGSKFPKIGRRVVVTFGTPLDFSRYAGMAEDRFVLRSITDEIMHEIARLTGQEYVDVYASNARRPGGNPPAPTAPVDPAPAGATAA